MIIEDDDEGEDEHEHDKDEQGRCKDDRCDLKREACL